MTKQTCCQFSWSGRRNLIGSGRTAFFIWVAKSIAEKFQTNHQELDYVFFCVCVCMHACLLTYVLCGSVLFAGPSIPYLNYRTDWLYLLPLVPMTIFRKYLFNVFFIMQIILIDQVLGMRILSLRENEGPVSLRNKLKHSIPCRIPAKESVVSNVTLQEIESFLFCLQVRNIQQAHLGVLAVWSASLKNSLSKGWGKSSFAFKS